MQDQFWTRSAPESRDWPCLLSSDQFWVPEPDKNSETRWIPRLWIINDQILPSWGLRQIAQYRDHFLSKVNPWLQLPTQIGILDPQDRARTWLLKCPRLSDSARMTQNGLTLIEFLHNLAPSYTDVLKCTYFTGQLLIKKLLYNDWKIGWNTSNSH